MSLLWKYFVGSIVVAGVIIGIYSGFFGTGFNKIKLN